MGAAGRTDVLFVRSTQQDARIHIVLLPLIKSHSLLVPRPAPPQAWKQSNELAGAAIANLAAASVEGLTVITSFARECVMLSADPRQLNGGVCGPL